MRDWLLGIMVDRMVERHLGPGRPLPRWLRALLDETFLWVALGQLLLALGVRPESVRRLATVQTVLEEARTALAPLGHEIPRLEGIRTHGDLERFEERVEGLESLNLADETIAAAIPAPTLVRWILDTTDVVLDLLDEVLQRLRALRIRTELIGLDHRAAAEAIRRSRRLLRGAGLAEAAEGGHAALARRLEEITADGDLLGGLELEARPRAPRRGEVARIVTVLRRLPRQTLDRLFPLRLLSSRLVLTAAIARVLEEQRKHWLPPGERPEPDESEADRHRAAERQWRRGRERFYAEVDAQDALPGRGRALLVHTGLLWLLALAVPGWCALVLATGLYGTGLDLPPMSTPEEMARASAQLRSLWPALVVATAGAGVLGACSEFLGEVDRIELHHSTLRSPADASPARRARRLAVRAARAAAAIVFLLPLLALPLSSLAGMLPDLPRAEVVDAWALGLGLGLPWAACAVGGVLGGPRGQAQAEERWSRLVPEPGPTRI
jgi:hypothetical protein